MLKLLILNPKQPSTDIDVYLKHFIDDLKLLWNGVKVYDAFGKEYFNLKVLLL